MTADSDHRLYFECLSKLAGRYRYGFWPAVGLIFVGFCWGFYLWTNQKAYLATCIPLVIAMALLPPLIRTAYDDLLQLLEQALGFIKTPTPELQRWFAHQLGVFTNRKTMHTVAVLSFLLSAVAYDNTEVFQTFSSLGHSFALLVAGSAGLFTGVALFHLFLLARLIWRVRVFPVRVEPYDCGVMSVGRFMFNYWVFSAVIWLICLSSWITTSGILVILFLIAIPSSFLIIVSFIVSMMPIHWQMVRFKQREIDAIKRSLAVLISPGYENLSADQREKVKFLEDRAARLNALPEWPFRPSSLIGVCMSSFATFLPSLVKFLLDSGRI